MPIDDRDYNHKNNYRAQAYEKYDNSHSNDKRSREKSGLGEQAQRSAVKVAERVNIPPHPAKSSRAEAMQRRARVNRILMRKRRQERSVNILFSPLAMTALISLVVLTVILSSSCGAAFAYYQSQLPLLNSIAQHSLFQTTHIYDRNGKLLYELYDNSIDHGRRTYVNYIDIPTDLVNATVAAEDHTFWSNTGVDYAGIVRAAIADFHSAGMVEGASTITQQLIKNQFFLNTLNNRTLPVKAQEAVLATGLTQQYPKWKIMEMYLNTVFYGHANFGIEAAAQDYFGLKPQCQLGKCKPAVSHLTLSESALLAGLPQSPSGYMPFANKNQALHRQAYVLQSMVDLKMITPAQKTQAQKEMEKYTFHVTDRIKNAPHFVDYVIEHVLIPLFGVHNLVNGGYDIYTTLDLDLERKVEQITRNQIYTSMPDAYGYANLKTLHNLNNAAVVVMDPKTGEILAMNGSVDYNDTSNDPRMQGQFNSAADALRQPGSSMKPFVYATAFQMGWYPAMVVPDVPTHFPDYWQDYAPGNYDHRFHGANMTIRRGIANSYNIPAIDTIEYAGISNVLNMAGRLGLTHIQHTAPDRQGPWMALGTSEETLLNMTGAYATFANQGKRMPQTSILQINDNQGRTLYKLNPNDPSRGEQILRPDVAYLINSMLSDTNARHEEFAPGNPLELDRPAAAKTGTTDQFMDNWTLGYTSHIAVGVWAGNSDNEQMYNVIGITGAGPIWNSVMNYADQRYHFPPDNFPRPLDIHQASVSALTGLEPHIGEAVNTDWFIDGTEPTMQGDFYVPPLPVFPKPVVPRKHPRH